MKKIFLTVGLLLTLSVGFGQTFITKKVSGMNSPTEWNVSDSLIIIKSLDPKVIDLIGEIEFRHVVESFIKNTGPTTSSTYYTESNGNKVRIIVLIHKGVYMVNYEVIDGFTGKITKMVYN